MERLPDEHSKVLIVLIRVIPVKPVPYAGRLQVFIGSEEAVPDRKHGAIITICVRLLPMVVQGGSIRTLSISSISPAEPLLPSRHRSN